MTNCEQVDVLVVGAGFCGSMVGLKVHEAGFSVRVLDTVERYPEVFRAEKLETDQFDMLASLGLREYLRPQETPQITTVHTFTGARVTVNSRSRHFGLDYADTVNAMRDDLQSAGIVELGRVQTIEDQSASCKVTVRANTGQEYPLEARVVLIATGMDRSMRRTLGFESQTNEALISTTFGFLIEPREDAGFRYDAFNFRPEKFVHGLHYITFFPIGERMRANLFTNWSPASDEARKMKADVDSELARYFPAMPERVGSYRRCSEVESYTTRYYRLVAPQSTRIIVVGDAFQSVNPANGVGLSKCLTDVQAFLQALPGLLTDEADSSVYYRNTRKASVDAEALRRWSWAVESATSRSLKTRLKRTRIALSSRFHQWRRRLGL